VAIVNRGEAALSFIHAALERNREGGLRGSGPADILRRSRV